MRSKGRKWKRRKERVMEGTLKPSKKTRDKEKMGREGKEWKGKERKEEEKENKTEATGRGRRDEDGETEFKWLLNERIEA